MTTLWNGQDAYDDRKLEAKVYGECVHLEDEDTSLAELTPASAVELGKALVAWGEEIR